MIMEYVEGDVLFDAIQAKGGFTEAESKEIMKQLIITLYYLHQSGVSHRDIKLENIMIDNNMKIKIIDFGFTSINNIECQNKFVGTGTYMAPEIRRGEVYDGRAVDIFSSGVVLFTMVS